MRAILVAVVLVAFGATADARFAATQGFSGKHGVDCGACHTADPLALDPPATVVLDGLPAAWDAGAAYALRVRVLGGPRANPVPGQPVGGFDLETDLGWFDVPSEMDGLLRAPSPTEMTYTAAGTLRREWSVLWMAPDAEREPTTARFWLAGVSANGNHVMNGPDAVGERGDRHARATFSIEPADATRRAWASRPLAPPVIDEFGQVIAAFEPIRTVSGHLPDDADGAEWRLDEGPWQAAIGAPHFFFNLGPVEPGPHSLLARTIAGERVSEPIVVAFRAEAPAGSQSAAVESLPPMWAVAAMMLVVVTLLSPLLWKLRTVKK